MARQPAAHTVFEDDEKENAKLSAKHKKLATEGIEIEEQLKKLKKRQNEIKDKLKEDLGTDERYTIIIPGAGTIPVVPKQELIVANANRLKEILGAEFDHNVDTKVSFKALDPLVDLAKDKDRPTCARLNRNRD